MHVTSDAMKAVYKRRPQVVKRYLSVLPYDVVYTAQANGDATRDNATNGQFEVAFDNGNGTLADVLPGHLLAVGTTPGAADVGLLRIRKAPTSTVFTVGETAPGDVPILDNLYLTVFDDFTRWSVKPRLVATNDNTEFEEYHDYDIAYADQNRAREPIVNIVARVVDAATKQFVPLKHAGWVDAGQTYRTVELDCGLSEMVGDGATSTPTAIAWDVHGWTVVEGSTSSAYLKVQMPIGAAWVSCTITDSLGTVKTGRRHLWTHDRDSYPPHTQFKVLKDSRRQWREMQVEFFEKQGANEDTSRTAIPYSCLCCYWEEATFGGQPAPDGYIDQFTGWVTEDEVDLIKGKSRHRLTIAGSGWWIDHLAGYMTTLSDHAGQDHWWEFKDPTVDLVAHYVLRETTTFMTLCNLFLSGDATPVAAEDINDGSIWRQVSDLASGARAIVGTDSGGGLWLRPVYSYLEWTTAYLGTEERSARPILMNIAPGDLRQGEVTITRRQYQPVGWATADGSWYVDGAESKQLYSKAPGLTPGDGADKTSAPYQRVGGATEEVAQKRLNAYGGHWLARENREIADFSAPFIANIDALEPCWNAPVRFTWNHANPAGLTFTDAEFVVVGVDVTHSNERGQPPKRVTSVLEQVAHGYPGDAYYPPGYDIPPWAYPSFNFVWPGWQQSVIPILQFGGAPLLYDFGVQPGPVAAILSDGTVRRVADFYDLNTDPLDWESIASGVTNIYAAARDPYSPAYRPPYTSNTVRAVIVYGSSVSGAQVNDPVLAVLTDIAGTPTVIDAYAIPDADYVEHARVQYHPGVKGLVIVTGIVKKSGSEPRDAVFLSLVSGQSWAEYLFEDGALSGDYHTAYGPDVFLRRLAPNTITAVATMPAAAGDTGTLYPRPLLTTDAASTFTVRTETQIPYLSGPTVGFGNDFALSWAPLAPNSNDDLALLVRADGSGDPRLFRSYRAASWGALVDITPTVGGADITPYPLGNSVAFAANDRERVLLAGRNENTGAPGVVAGQRLTSMSAADWWTVSQSAEVRGVILDRDGGAGYLFGLNGAVGYLNPFPLGSVFDRSIQGATARVLELVALAGIVGADVSSYDYFAIAFARPPLAADADMQDWTYALQAGTADNSRFGTPYDSGNNSLFFPELNVARGSHVGDLSIVVTITPGTPLSSVAVPGTRWFAFTYAESTVTVKWELFGAGMTYLGEETHTQPGSPIQQPEPATALPGVTGIAFIRLTVSTAANALRLSYIGIDAHGPDLAGGGTGEIVPFKVHETAIYVEWWAYYPDEDVAISAVYFDTDSSTEYLSPAGVPGYSEGYVERFAVSLERAVNGGPWVDPYGNLDGELLVEEGSYSQIEATLTIDVTPWCPNGIRMAPGQMTYWPVRMRSDPEIHYEGVFTLYNLSNAAVWQWTTPELSTWEGPTDFGNAVPWPNIRNIGKITVTTRSKETFSLAVGETASINMRFCDFHFQIESSTP